MNSKNVLEFDVLKRKADKLASFKRSMETFPAGSIEYNEMDRYCGVIEDEISAKLAEMKLNLEDCSDLLKLVQFALRNGKDKDGLLLLGGIVSKSLNDVLGVNKFNLIDEASRIANDMWTSKVNEWVNLNVEVGEKYDALAKMESDGQKNSLEYDGVLNEVRDIVKKSDKLFATFGKSLDELKFLGEYLDHFQADSRAYERCQKIITEKLTGDSNRHQKMVVGKRIIRYINEVCDRGLGREVKESLTRVKYRMCYDEFDNSDMERYMLFGREDDSICFDDDNYGFLVPEALLTMENMCYLASDRKDNIDDDSYYYLILNEITLMAMMDVMSSGMRKTVEEYWKGMVLKHNISRDSAWFLAIDGVMNRYKSKPKKRMAIR